MCSPLKLIIYYILKEILTSLVILIKGEQSNILLMDAHRSNENMLTLLIETNKIEAQFVQKGNKNFECHTTLEAQKEKILVC